MKTAALAMTLVTAAIWTTAVWAVETVRVDASSGVPQILVDGKPVRSRMFWGGPGTRPLSIGPKAQAVDFEFTPAFDEPGKATMHFRFGQKAGDVYVDDIRVVEVGTGREVIPQCDFEQGSVSFDRHWIVFPPKSRRTRSGRSRSSRAADVTVRPDYTSSSRLRPMATGPTFTFITT